MAERLRGKTTGRWEAGRAVCAWGEVRGKRCKSVAGFCMGPPPLFLRDKLKNKDFLFLNVFGCLCLFNSDVSETQNHKSLAS